MPYIFLTNDYRKVAQSVVTTSWGYPEEGGFENEWIACKQGKAVNEQEVSLNEVTYAAVQAYTSRIHTRALWRQVYVCEQCIYCMLSNRRSSGSSRSSGDRPLEWKQHSKSPYNCKSVTVTMHACVRADTKCMSISGSAKFCVSKVQHTQGQFQNPSAVILPTAHILLVV